MASRSSDVACTNTRSIALPTRATLKNACFLAGNRVWAIIVCEHFAKLALSSSARGRPMSSPVVKNASYRARISKPRTATAAELPATRAANLTAELRERATSLKSTTSAFSTRASSNTSSRGSRPASISALSPSSKRPAARIKHRMNDALLGGSHDSCNLHAFAGAACAEATRALDSLNRPCFRRQRNAPQAEYDRAEARPDVRDSRVDHHPGASCPREEREGRAQASLGANGAVQLVLLVHARLRSRPIVDGG